MDPGVVDMSNRDRRVAANQRQNRATELRLGRTAPRPDWPRERVTESHAHWLRTEQPCDTRRGAHMTSTHSWNHEPVTANSDSTLRGQRLDRPQMARAVEFVQRVLGCSDGTWYPSRLLEEEAEYRGISKYWVQRAKDRLGVKSRKNTSKPGEPWECWLPVQETDAWFGF